MADGLPHPDDEARERLRLSMTYEQWVNFLARPEAPLPPSPQPDCSFCRGTGWTSDEHYIGSSYTRSTTTSPCACWHKA